MGELDGQSYPDLCQSLSSCFGEQERSTVGSPDAWKLSVSQYRPTIIITNTNEVNNVRSKYTWMYSTMSSCNQYFYN